VLQLYYWIKSLSFSTQSYYIWRPGIHTYWCRQIKWLHYTPEYYYITIML